MTLHEKHIHLIELVNRATTERERYNHLLQLTAWRAGVQDAGVELDLIAADEHYLDQGIDRDMCCGVWLDWSEPQKPTPTNP